MHISLLSFTAELLKRVICFHFPMFHFSTTHSRKVSLSPPPHCTDTAVVWIFSDFMLPVPLLPLLLNFSVLDIVAFSLYQKHWVLLVSGIAYGSGVPPAFLIFASRSLLASSLLYFSCWSAPVLTKSWVLTFFSYF